MAYSYKKFSITKIDRLIQELDHLEKVQDMRRVIELLVP
jgi:hypothetical protein